MILFYNFILLGTKRVPPGDRDGLSFLPVAGVGTGDWPAPFSDESGRKRTENCSTVFIFIFLNGNGSGSRTAGNENGCGINGNTKTGKYGQKIDENER
jgi:hypothetical protein